VWGLLVVVGMEQPSCFSIFSQDVQGPDAIGFVAVHDRIQTELLKLPDLEVIQMKEQLPEGLLEVPMEFGANRAVAMAVQAPPFVLHRELPAAGAEHPYRFPPSLIAISLY